MTTTHTEQLNKKEAITIRPPIVVVLGHVDHGKSSLLEAIREDFRITAKESGGITQHIGAYMVEHEGKHITFLDTPGHELFSAMRSRGAKVADIAVLVVAADESVKPQTIEAIEQIKKAGIPMVVAINKIDKPEAQADRVKQELAQHEVIVESYGGNVPSVETSATTKQGMKELLEMILLVAEVEQFQSSLQDSTTGTVIESHMDAQRGPTATIIVATGKIGLGDYVAAPSTYGKVRMMEDFKGQSIQEAFSSTPAVVLGFLETPLIGEEVRVFATEQEVQAFMQESKARDQEVGNSKTSRAHREGVSVSVVLKADVAGSLEALETALQGIQQEGAYVYIAKTGVGDVGENDIKTARSVKAAVLAFKVKTSPAALDLAEKEAVTIQSFDIIYEVIEATRKLAEQAVVQKGGREDLGALHVLGVFLVDKTRQVIGGKVAEGEIKKGMWAEIVRESEVVGLAKVTNVQKEKKDVPRVTQGQECGLSVEAAERIQEGDTLQFFIDRPAAMSKG